MARVERVAGRIEFDGRDVTGLSTGELVVAGVALCPENRRLFPNMSIEDNLLLGAYGVRARVQRQRLDATYDRFEWIGGRRGELAGVLERRSAAGGGHRPRLHVGAEGGACSTSRRAGCHRWRSRRCGRCSPASPPMARRCCSSSRTSSWCSRCAQRAIVLAHGAVRAAGPVDELPAGRHRRRRLPRRHRPARGRRHRRPDHRPIDQGDQRMITSQELDVRRQPRLGDGLGVARRRRHAVRRRAARPRVRRAHRALRARRRGARRRWRRGVRTGPHRPRPERRGAGADRRLRRRAGRSVGGARAGWWPSIPGCPCAPDRALDGRHHRGPVRRAARRRADRRWCCSGTGDRRSSHCSMRSSRPTGAARRGDRRRDALGADDAVRRRPTPDRPARGARPVQVARRLEAMAATGGRHRRRRVARQRSPTACWASTAPRTRRRRSAARRPCCRAWRRGDVHVEHVYEGAPPRGVRRRPTGAEACWPNAIVAFIVIALRRRGAGGDASHARPRSRAGKTG